MNSRNENRPGYKETKVGWIPEDWGIGRLDSAYSVKTGPFGTQLHKSDYVNVGTPIVTVEHLGERSLIHKNLPLVSVEDKERLSQYLLKEGDIVFSRVGSVDRNSLITTAEDGWLFSGRLLRVRKNNNELDPRFLSFYFNQTGFKNYMHRIAVGGIMKNLNTTLLSGVPVAFPPLPEQRIIAEILTTWDKAIDLVGNQIDAKQRLKKGLMQQLLTGKMRFPGFDGEWWEYKIGDISYLIAGGTPSTRVPQYWGGNIRWMKSGDIHLRRIYEVENKITQEGLDNSSAKMLPVNSVLVALAGQGKTRGTVGINKVELSTNQSIAAIIPDNNNLNYEFLFYNLDFRYEELRKLSTGDGGRGGLNLGLLRSIKVFTPSAKEQKRIVNILAYIEYEITKLQEKIRALQKQKQGLMLKLLTGEVRVKV